jgi:MFS family permease
LSEDRLLPSKGEKQPRVFYGYFILLASFVILMVVWGAHFSFGVFFKPVLSEFGWTRAATSGVYSLTLFLIGLYGIFFGRLSDRFGPRLVATVCGLLMGIGYLLMSRIWQIWQMYLIYGLLISVGVAGTWVPLLSTVTRWFVKRRGLASGITMAGIGVGAAIMPPLANQLISSYSWRTSYVIIGLIILALSVVPAQFLRRDPSEKGLLAYGADSVSTASSGSGVQGSSLREALRVRQFWIILVMCLLGGIGVHTVMVHIVPHATDIGVVATDAATILSVVGIMSIGTKIGTGGIADKSGSRRVMIIAFVLMSVSFVVLLFARELPALYLAAAIFAGAYGGFITAQSPIVAEFFGLRAHGEVFGMAVFAFLIGGATGSLASGRIFDVSGSYYWAFVVCASLGVAGLALSLSLKSRRK